MYGLMRPLLFSMDAERAHQRTLAMLARSAPLAQRVFGRRVLDMPCDIMGLRLRNPVGLAAGLDKDGHCIDGLAALGFGFLEIGTVTPRAQPGNALPRLYRLPRDGALINRMGFNNNGVDALLKRLQTTRYDGVLGINIGKNATTPLDRAVDDYLYCLEAVYPYADYVTVNISSPNTRGLRDLQAADPVDALLAALAECRSRLADRLGKRVPLALKIAPDLDTQGLRGIADALRQHGLDAVIATNTTLQRPALGHTQLVREAGGLSGAPLRELAEQTLQRLAHYLEGSVPIIGVGGIMTGQHARDRIEAGAAAIQLYTGLIYRGPALVRECVAALV